MTRYLSPSAGGSPQGKHTLSPWLWTPLFFGSLALTCWLVASCSSDGPVRRSDQAPPGVTAYTPPPGASYIGAEVCAGCHEKEAKAYEATHHGKKADPRSPASKQECETCHGPGSVHAENGGGKGTIRSFGSDSPCSAAEKTAICLGCHEKKWNNWENGAHAAHDVACVDCHSIHNGSKKNPQLKFDFQPDVCAQCHKNVRADLNKQSHHPILEGKVVCTDCHNPHGTNSRKNLNAASVNELCYKCHTEKRGPFLWEHPPVMAGCTTCHQPHGSIHNKLLTESPPILCERCHSVARHPGQARDASTLFKMGAAAAQVLGESCMNCHDQIHGSNHPSGKLFLR